MWLSTNFRWWCNRVGKKKIVFSHSRVLCATFRASRISPPLLESPTGITLNRFVTTSQKDSKNNNQKRKFNVQHLFFFSFYESTFVSKWTPRKLSEFDQMKEKGFSSSAMTRYIDQQQRTDTLVSILFVCSFGQQVS